MESSKKPISLLEAYLERKGIKVDINTRRFSVYRTCSNEIQEVSNIAIFPKKKYEEIGDDWISNSIYICDLLVLDQNYETGIIEKEITINQNEHLKTFEALKQHLVLQEPTICIDTSMKKSGEKRFLDIIRLQITAGFEKVFWLDVWYRIPRIWFNEDWTIFTFNNWKLNLTNETFEEWEYNLIKGGSISLSYCPEAVDKLTLEQSLSDCIAMEKYVSDEKSIAAITIWYLICGIFRKEYKAIHNEFPFLWFEWYSWYWKTSLLNFLSRAVGYNWNSINWVCDSDFAFEVGMDSLWSRFYFVDEIQKISSKLQKYIQSAYNSWENHKWWANGKRREVQTYRKDFSLIAAWEVLPQQEEALLNRFIICCPRKSFAVKKQVNDIDELIKYVDLSGKDIANEQFLNTEEIKYLAINYYKPRFMCILKHKNSIDFKRFHDEASMLIEKYVDWSIDTRHKNNLLCAITGYSILRQWNINEEEIKEIIRDYFSRLETYRKKTIMSWVIVNYILENISEFSSWLWRVKWTAQYWPMVWIKYSDNEQWLILQVDKIIMYCKTKFEIRLKNNHCKQQLVELLWIKDLQSKQIKFAKWESNISGTFIPLNIVEKNELLRNIWDVTLSYQHSHMLELNHILSGEKQDWWMYHQPIQKVIPDVVLEKLCEELEQTYEKADFFNKELFSKSDSEEDEKPF